MRFSPLLALALITSPAVAQKATSSATPQTADAQDEKQVCRRIQVTGSNFAKRECHTKAEWAAQRKANEDNAQRALENRRPGAGTDGI